PCPTTAPTTHLSGSNGTSPRFFVIRVILNAAGRCSYLLGMGPSARLVPPFSVQECPMIGAFRRVCFALLALASPMLPASDFVIGIDLIRVVDKNQDDGLDNIWFQFSTSGNGAVLIGYASGDNLTVLDVGYKHYLGGR